MVEKDAPPALERAVFAAKQGRIVGPLRTLSSPSSSSYSYYVFTVTGRGKPSSLQPLTQVASQIRQALTQQLQQQSWVTFTLAYAKRWTARTLCAPRYVVPDCRNYLASTAGRGS